MDKKLIGQYVRPFSFGQRLLELQAKDRDKRRLVNVPLPVTPVFDQFLCGCGFELEQICKYCKSLGLGRYGVQVETPPIETGDIKFDE